MWIEYNKRMLNLKHATRVGFYKSIDTIEVVLITGEVINMDNLPSEEYETLETEIRSWMENDA